MYDYKIEEEKKKQESYLVNYESVICLLEGIKFITKKDGTPYQHLIKNIDLSEVKGIRNATVSLRKDYGTLADSNELHFTFYNKEGKWQEFNIALCEFDINIDKVAPERIIKESFLRPYYRVELSDLKSIIEHWIEVHKRWILEQKERLSKFDKAVQIAKDFERKFREEINDTHLWWVIKECF